MSNEYRKEMVKGALERRSQESVLEMRDAGEGILELRGYAATFGNWYEIGDPDRGGFRERIAQGSATRTLSENPDVVLNLDHGRSGSGMPLARTGRNLSLSQDDHGLAFRAELEPSDPDVALLRSKMNAGLVDRCSFAFRCTADAWNSDRSERTITGFTLHHGDVSMVVVPANDRARAELVARSATVEGPVTFTVDPVRRAREQMAVLERRERVRAQLTEPQAGSLPDLTTPRRKRLAALRGQDAD